MKTEYITHRGPGQWGIMAYDLDRKIWVEPVRWYRTRAEAREILRTDLPCRYHHCAEPASRRVGWQTPACDYHHRLAEEKEAQA